MIAIGAAPRRQIDPAWARSARLTLFGVDWGGGSALLTPIRSLFTRLATGGIVHDGWWPTASVGRHLVVHVPQGSPATDAVYALPAGTSVLFLGLAGSLHEQPAGEFFEATSAVMASASAMQGDDVQAIPHVTAAHATTDQAAGSSPRGVAVATVECLADSTRWHDQLGHIADCVDMETAHLFIAARSTGRHLRSFLVISDENLGGAVFDSNIDGMATRFDEACDLVRTTMARPYEASESRGGDQ